jgi:hypothetical protein
VDKLDIVGPQSCTVHVSSVGPSLFTPSLSLWPWGSTFRLARVATAYRSIFGPDKTILSRQGILLGGPSYYLSAFVPVGACLVFCFVFVLFLFFFFHFIIARTTATSRPPRRGEFCKKWNGLQGSSVESGEVALTSLSYKGYGKNIFWQNFLIIRLHNL